MRVGFHQGTKGGQGGVPMSLAADRDLRLVTQSAWRRPRVMITKDFIIVKDFCTYSIRILRQGKILHDHGADRVVVAYTSPAVLKVRNHGGDS
jgi:hypothetical protein